MRIDGSRIWVVGASSGIGASVARELADRGAHVAISSRDVEALSAVSGGRMHVERMDVTKPLQVDVAAAGVRAGLGGLDAVVLSAGHWQQGEPGTLVAEEFAAHIETNLVGTARVISAVLPDLRAQGSGLIVAVASVAGFRGLPGGEGYGASKAGLINLLEALRSGLHGTGVRVQAVCPGFVETPLTRKNSFPMPFIIEADEAAAQVVRGIESERPVVVFPWQMALLARAARYVPAGVWSRITAPSGPRARSHLSH